MLRFCALASLLLGCAEPTLSTSPASSSPLAIAEQHRPSGAELIDLRADGAAIWGVAQPAPANATVMPLFEAALLTADGHRHELPVMGGLVRDARLGPLEANNLAFLDRDHLLWTWRIGDQAPLKVSDDAYPGVSFSSDGRALVYAAGPRPELELYLFDLSSHESRQLTHLDAPLALPAFVDDDSILFASAFSGVPALWLVGRDGRGLRQLTNRDITTADFETGATILPMPEGRRPPLQHGSAIVFEAAGDLHAVDREGTLLWQLANADLPHHSIDGQLWLRTAAEIRLVSGAAP